MLIDKLLEILKDRGFCVALKDGGPVLRGDRDKITPALQESLKFHRAKIIEHLQKQVDVKI